MKCILCRAELCNPIGTQWVCDTEGCDAAHVWLPEAMARALSGVRVPGGRMGRKPKTPAYKLNGVAHWDCACCGAVVPESEMDVDRSWCKKCKRKSVADTRRRTGRVDRP